MNKDLYAQYPNLIVSIESVDFVRREGMELYKAKLMLADGSNLRISEVWMDGKLVKYAYYRLDEREQLIVGWDNAPHHPRIKSHPHHMHRQDSIIESTVRTLEDVLTLLAQELEL